MIVVRELEEWFKKISHFISGKWILPWYCDRRLAMAEKHIRSFMLNTFLESFS